MKQTSPLIKSMPILQALLAAALFGISAPFSKALLGEVDAIPLAGFLYLGSGLGALILMLLQKPGEKRRTVEAPLTWQDAPWLAGAIVTGGIAAPILLLFGLQNTPASTASLLLNFETVATALLAGMFFKEAVGKRIALAILVITSASILLSLNSGGWGFSPSALLILLACFCWGADNNFTRNISAKNPLAIVAVKGMVAGSFSLLLALILGHPFPNLSIFGLALILGAICYGLSISLIVLAMRHLGSTRTYALFSVAPFIGTLFSFILFREKLLWNFWPGIALMIFGAWIMVSEKHNHSHQHLAISHTHSHIHPEEHHLHTHHAEQTTNNGVHAHHHEHEKLLHIHPHTPDIHHRHTHGKSATQKP